MQCHSFRWLVSINSFLYLDSFLLVSIRGYANPDMAFLDTMASADASLFSDLGPEVTHYYEVSNFGPFDVGKVIVSLVMSSFAHILIIEFEG